MLLNKGSCSHFMQEGDNLPGTLVFDALAAEIRRRDKTLVLAGKVAELVFMHSTVEN